MVSIIDKFFSDEQFTNEEINAISDKLEEQILKNLLYKRYKLDEYWITDKITNMIDTMIDENDKTFFDKIKEYPLYSKLINYTILKNSSTDIFNFIMSYPVDEVVNQKYKDYDLFFLSSNICLSVQ